MSSEEWEAFGGDPNSPPTTVASVGGRPLTNVVTLAHEPWLGWDCLALKRDGTVLTLQLNPMDFGFADFSGPDHPVTARQVAVDGEVLTNVVAVSHRGGHCRALKSDGTAVAWCALNLQREALPPGLRDLAAISPGDTSLALRRDGTVVMWGSYTNVPAGLTNVIAIAAEWNFWLAITTNNNWALLRK
jgi:hypothetical protein